jgi:undecaprenyl-diphosphatase
MQLMQAVVLGIVQGLTEFLPVSSSAHLILAREVFGWRLLDNPHWNMIFDVSAHAGTFVALVAYLWADIRRLLGAFFASFRGGFDGLPERRLAWIIVIATIPAAAAGFLGQDAIEASLRGAPMMVAGLLVIFGVILWLAERRSRKARELGQTGWLDGVLIGCAQALALAPGVSRSGITMTVGLARGMTRETAARFSFLLSTPIVGGAALFGLKNVMAGLGALPQGSLATLGLGFISAALSGYLCLHYFLHYLQRHALAPFVIYRVALGAFLLVWFGVR